MEAVYRLGRRGLRVRYIDAMSDDELIERIRRLLAGGVRPDRADAACPPAAEEVLRRAERTIGHPLPPFLRRVYSEVGNGGACMELLGVVDGESACFTEEEDDTADRYYEWWRAGDPSMPEWRWPEFLLPISDVGCGMKLCVRCDDERAKLVRFEAGGSTDWGVGLIEMPWDLRGWFAEKCDRAEGLMPDPRPFRPRKVRRWWWPFPA